MERLSQLEPRTSVLEDDFDEEALEVEGKAAAAAAVPPDTSQPPALLCRPVTLEPAQILTALVGPDRLLCYNALLLSASFTVLDRPACHEPVKAAALPVPDRQRQRWRRRWPQRTHGSRAGAAAAAAPSRAGARGGAARARVTGKHQSALRRNER